MKTNLKALSEKEMEDFVQSLGQRPYRTKQIVNWIYKKGAASVDDMTDLPKSFREMLKNKAFIGGIKLLTENVSKDHTRKYLFELGDKEKIESVLIPDKNRLTLCISSQAGCAMRCKFCRTGRMGLRRNLKAYEIVDQVLQVQKMLRESKITNIVYMGMGEPLNNFTEVVESLWRITGLLGFSRRRVTLSTAGVVPKIPELAEKAPRINLAVSLNAADDAARDLIMPINKKYPLAELIKAIGKFPLDRRSLITFEYVLLDGINDSEADAMKLVKLLKGIRSKINLIPYNPIASSGRGAGGILKDADSAGLKRPPEQRILTFQKILLDKGLNALLRKSRGSDISAACGQLAAQCVK